MAGGLNPCGRERGRARARGCKRKLGVMSWGKGLINIGLEGRRNEEEEEVKRREVTVLKKIKNKVEEEMEKEDKEGLSVKKSNDPPRFAHICKTVRKKEERKKLRGFDCKLCEDYYQAHLDEDFDTSQVEEKKNKNSKHRGLFKPPLTPERFWDPDIIEDDEDDPRSEIVVGAPPLRKRRGEKRFDVGVGEAVMGSEFEMK